MLQTLVAYSVLGARCSVLGGWWWWPVSCLRRRARAGARIHAVTHNETGVRRAGTHAAALVHGPSHQHAV